MNHALKGCAAAATSVVVQNDYTNLLTAVPAAEPKGCLSGPEHAASDSIRERAGGVLAVALG